MAIAALVTWLVTAVLGFTMLGMWVSGGGVRAASSTDGAATSRLTPGLVFGHFLLAAAGLVVWIVYLVVDSDPLTWVALAVLVVVAVAGALMFGRWRRSRTGGAVEARFPRPVVYVHGLFAAATVVLVLLTALGLGES